MWSFGISLRNFSPITAEHLMWAARPTDQDMEVPVEFLDPYAVMYAGADNRGTNPHLCSAKYTGYGITLRASVDTPAELSVHLTQIDDGPNYRWGTAAEGACGVVYFFADGKGFSHNGSEDVGDRIDQDTDFGSTFGVWKNGAFRAIGQNVLTEPLLDLGLAQYARILPRRDPHAYSWPEYQSRSVLLAGDDYFILHDRVFNPQIAHRFSWFVRRGDAFPTIIHLPPAHQNPEFTTIETHEVSGRWADGFGDSLVLISHRDSIQADPTPYGARVHLSDGTDHVFATPEPIVFNEESIAFTGSSALIRRRLPVTAFALFHGTHLAVPGLTLTLTSPDLAISGTVPTDATAPIRGLFSQPTPSTIELSHPTPNHRFYLDGQLLPTTAGSAISLPAGTHAWELTPTLPMPLTPTIARTESTAAGAIVIGTPVASATTYELHLSPDNAITWKPAAQSPQPTIPLTGLIVGAKYHLRLRARNPEQTTPWSPEYPVYITDAPPSPPDGLHLELSPGAATLTWGEVLGASAYRLSRKRPGEPAFTPVYTGLERTWTDRNPRFAPATQPPVDPTPITPEPLIHMYRVTTLTHIGESQPSRHATSDPTSWRTWNPTPGEPFRRTVERTEGPLPNDHTGRFYPA